MPVVPFHHRRPRSLPRSLGGRLDPRRLFAVVLLLSLAALGTLPHVAEALSGVAAPLPRHAASGCRVTGIIDGDTVRLVCAGRPAERARLTGFDTPELFSPKCAVERRAAGRAKQHLGRLIGDAERLGVARHGHDRYGRALVALSVDGRPVAREMIAAGLARPYDGGHRRGWCGVAERVPERHISAKLVRVRG